MAKKCVIQNRFNYDSNNNSIKSNTIIPLMLINVIYAQRFLIEQDYFRQMILFFGKDKVVIRKYNIGNYPYTIELWK